NNGSSAMATFANTTFTGNSSPQGGGVGNNVGTVTFTGGTLSNNTVVGAGGGVVNSGGATTTVRNSLISGNTAGGGGGIWNDAALNLVNVTMTGNTSTGGGGGLNHNSGTVSVSSVTISSNGAVNGGGVYLNAPATFTNTIVAGNTASSAGPDCRVQGANTFASNGHNLIQTTTGCTFSGPQTGDITGTDPLLAPLAGNGGLTLTAALLTGSPALNAGDNTVCDTVATVNGVDQRGLARPQGGTCDIGAYEAALVSLSAATASLAENGGSAGLTVTLSAAPPTGTTVTVNYATADGTANVAGTGLGQPDYTNTAGTLTWAAGDGAGKTFSVPVLNDAVYEGDETVAISLSGAGNAVVGATAAATLTIADDETPPTLSINNVSLAEGAAGTTASFGFTVTLSGQSVQTVTADYATANGTAIAPGDYTALTTATLTFAAGETTKTVMVTANGDATFEADETFAVGLSNPSNTTIATGTGTGTIQNDDPPPTIGIGNVTVVEGRPGETLDAVFAVTLSTAGGLPVTVAFATADGTAQMGDYQAQTGTVSFAPGETSKMITVVVIGDNGIEETERFFVNLSAPSNATIAVAQGTGTITNDDFPTGGGGGGNGTPAVPTVPTQTSVVLTFDRVNGGTVRSVNVTLSVPGGAVPGFGSLVLTLGEQQPSTELPQPVNGVLGVQIIEVTLRDSVGALIHDLTAAASVQITLSTQDLELAGGDPTRLRLMRFDEATKQWVELTGAVSADGKTLTVSTQHFSTFVIVAVQPAAEATGLAEAAVVAGLTRC
ncbi:MAG: hypothetical protein NTZ05_14190, partial [Chloroflexi bacterium]|nr:hypothetical protein [Chloroflexota bacterium]